MQVVDKFVQEQKVKLRLTPPGLASPMKAGSVSVGGSFNRNNGIGAKAAAERKSEAPSQGELHAAGMMLF